MSITQTSFGVTGRGEAVTCWRLTSPAGASTEILSCGAATRRVDVPDGKGALRSVCLSFDAPEEYEAGASYSGAVVGRHAGRIGDGRFTLGGQEYRLAVNDPPNHLHGGPGGLARQVWQGETDGERLVLRRHSPHGEEGYPGALTVTAVYEWTAPLDLTLTLEGVSDRDTLLSLTHHGYWNLMGRGSVGEHLYQTPAPVFVEADGHTLPTGRLLSVEGTPFDFRAPRRLEEAMGQAHPQLIPGCGFDHTFPVPGEGLRTLGVLRAPDGLLSMTVESTLPALHLYTGRGTHAALEAQLIPDAIHHPHFPSPLLRAGAVWRHVIRYRFFHE